MYVLELFDRARSIPYSVNFYSVAQKWGKNDVDLTNEELGKCESDTFLMEDEDCISEMFQNSEKKVSLGG